jgi:hypothetical protein
MLRDRGSQIMWIRFPKIFVLPGFGAGVCCQGLLIDDHHLLGLRVGSFRK